MAQMNLPPEFVLDQPGSSGSSLPPGFVVDRAPEEQPQQQQPAPTSSDIYKNISQFTPQGMLEAIPPLLNKGAAYMGEKATDMMSQPNIRRNLLTGGTYSTGQFPAEIAAGVGTALTMAPDIGLMAAVPVQKAGPAVEAAVPLARRALGFQKSLLKTPFARGQATQAAEVALEKNILPVLGSPSKALDNASIFSAKTGNELGSVLGKTPASLEKTFTNLENLREKLTQGTQGGVYSQVNSAINSVQESILELASKGKNVSASMLTDLKTRLGNSINYLADIASQSDNKAIVSTLSNTIRDAVKGFTSPEKFASFLENQKLYNASKLMMKGLNNEVAGQMGNRATSLLSVIPATGQLAAGNLPGAAATLGIAEAGLRRGAGLSARAIQDAGINAPKILATAAVGTKMLTEDKAREYYERAKSTGETDKEKLKALGRKYAKEDGWSF